VIGGGVIGGGVLGEAELGGATLAETPTVVSGPATAG
jgi:hypothetical protein